MVLSTSNRGMFFRQQGCQSVENPTWITFHPRGILNKKLRHAHYDPNSVIDEAESSVTDDRSELHYAFKDF